MSEKNPIRVFVTHAFAESDDYLRVFEFLESVERFFYLNVSKPENIPTEGGVEAIKDELIQQIKASEAVVIAPDVYGQKTDLVTYMMDVAEANNIGMIAIKPFGGLAETAPEVCTSRRMPNPRGALPLRMNQSIKKSASSSASSTIVIVAAEPAFRRGTANMM